MCTTNSFSIRVYGFLSNQKGQILISNEKYQGREFTKFPGGGLKLNESTLEGLKRELVEELNISPNIGRHIYTCDFLVKNQFDLSKQVIGIYYEVALSNEELDLIDKTINTSKVQGDLVLINREWCNRSQIESRLTFPMDIKAAHFYLKNTFT